MVELSGTQIDTEVYVKLKEKVSPISRGRHLRGKVLVLWKISYVGNIYGSGTKASTVSHVATIEKAYVQLADLESPILVDTDIDKYDYYVVEVV